MEEPKRQRMDPTIPHAVSDKATLLPANIEGEEPRKLAARKDINANSDAQCKIRIDKVAAATGEHQQRASCSNNNSLSEVNMELVKKEVMQPLAWPSLQCEERASGEAAKAAPHVKTTNENSMKPAGKETAGPFLEEVDSQENFVMVKEEAKVSVNIKFEISAEPLCKVKTEIGETSALDSTDFNKQQDVSLQPKDNLNMTPELPPGVEDVDAMDPDPSMFMTTYIKDYYKYLMDMDVKHQLEPDYLRNQNHITHQKRTTLLRWVMIVHDKYQLLTETLHLTVGIIDRYLQITPNVRCDQLLVIGATALFIASKYEEKVYLDLNHLLCVGQGSYTKRDVIKCEKDILIKLDFCMNKPKPISFLKWFAKVGHCTSEQENLAMYFVELCLLRYSMAHYRASAVAAAAICLSLNLLSEDKLEDVWTPSLQYYSTYTLRYIQPIITQIAIILVRIKKTRYQYTVRKYQSVSLDQVSNLPELQTGYVLELADYRRMDV